MAGLVTRWYLVLPLAALVYMLFQGFTPLYAGSIGLAFTVALILGASIALGLPDVWLRYLFWTGLALVGYVIPFIFVYSPALMLQAGDPTAARIGFAGAVALATFKALIAIALFGIIAIGFLFTRLALWERGAAMAAALCLLGDFPYSDTLGFLLTVFTVRLAMAAASARRGSAGLSLCLASAGSVKALALAAFTLAWTHSVEKIEWQEDWRVTPQGLQLVSARVKGSSAGMEPPPEARLSDGWFQWQVARAPLPEVLLGNSGAAGEWRVCARALPHTLGYF